MPCIQCFLTVNVFFPKTPFFNTNYVVIYSELLFCQFLLEVISFVVLMFPVSTIFS